MTIQATFNPIGSTSPKDLIDNAQNLDYLVVAAGDVYSFREVRLYAFIAAGQRARSIADRDDLEEKLRLLSDRLKVAGL